MPSVAAIIPATGDEAETVGGVVAAAAGCGAIDEVLVVDNGSTPGTTEAASEVGAEVVVCEPKGKGQALATGVAATEAELLLFLDADLLNLTVDHVDRLVGAIDDRVGMVMGLFDRGPVSNQIFLNLLPILTGQRALWRQLFEELDPDEYKGYKVEASLNSLCAARGIGTEAFILPGLWHRTKEEKFEDPVLGFAHKQAMLLTAGWGYASFRLRRLWKRRRAEVRAGWGRFVE